MPIYEYRCNGCRKRQTLFFRSVATVTDPVCPECGSRDMRRLVSLFAVLRSEESRLDDLADPSAFGDLDENDPRSIARWARRMGAEMGEELGPEFDEMIERMEAGEMPDEMGEFGGGDDTTEDGGEEGGDD
ncbi:MAG: zinc ribbon domain-containing protein [Chloroflexota bacterium]|nr:zinc ribbon domain-containing protein [Dehalococcoidia bacterium]MDW8253080.1 zinc ribbon domain-containing protein [Chloroflexota bacterium]